MRFKIRYFITLCLVMLLLSVYQMSWAAERLAVIKLNTLSEGSLQPVTELLDEIAWTYETLNTANGLSPATYPTALFPLPLKADAVDVEAIKAYIEAGGRLVVLPPADGVPDNSVTPVFEAMGLTLGSAGFTTEDTGLKWATTPKTTSKDVRVTDTLGVGAQMFAVTGGQVLARWNQEYPAIVTGKQNSVFLNWAFARELLLEVNAFALTHALGIPWPIQDPGTQVAAIISDGVGFYESPQLKTRLDKLAYYETRLNDAIEMALKLGVPMPVKEAQKLMLESNLYKARFIHNLKRGDDYHAQQAFEEAERLLARASLLTTSSPRVEGRAIWLDRGTIVKSGGAAGLKKIMQRIAESGINVVYFETINAGFPVYPSKLTMQNPLTEGWDPLKVAVEEGHRLGVEVHAWVWVFAVGNTRHNPIIGQSPKYEGPVLNETGLMSEALRNSGGGLMAKGTQHEFWLSPASPKARQFLKDEFAEIVTNYDVDGLHLDYIRYPFQSSSAQMGYEDVGRQRFYNSTKASLGTGGASKVWIAWKTYQVSSFVKEVSEMVRAVRPEVKISAAVFPMPRSSRILALQQDWETWLDNGWVDMLSPMSYTSSPRKLRNTYQSVIAATRKKSIVYPGIAIDRLDAQDLLTQVNTIRERGGMGNTLFAMAHLDAGKVEALKDGPYRERKTLTPHKDPLLAVKLLMDDFSTKYNALLQKNALPALNDEERTALKTSLADVTKELEVQIAEKENGTLTLAGVNGLRAKITALNGPIQLWFAQEHKEHPYRVAYFSEIVTRVDFLMEYLSDRTENTVAKTTPVPQGEEEFKEPTVEDAEAEAAEAKPKEKESVKP